MLASGHDTDDPQTMAAAIAIQAAKQIAISALPPFTMKLDGEPRRIVLKSNQSVSVASQGRIMEIANVTLSGFSPSRSGNRRLL